MTMSTQEFFAETTRRKVAEAIARAEAQTSAEIVVVLRRTSSSSRAPALLFGVACGFATLVALLFLPTRFALSAFIVDVLVVFAVAAWSARYFPGLLHALTPNDERVRNVRQAAAATFLTRGVHRCKGRNGILVFVSMLERVVEVVADIAIDHGTMEHARARANAALAAGDVDAFAASLEALGVELAERHPRGADDVNELSDDVARE